MAKIRIVCGQAITSGQRRLRKKLRRSCERLGDQIELVSTKGLGCRFVIDNQMSVNVAVLFVPADISKQQWSSEAMHCVKTETFNHTLLCCDKSRHEVCSEFAHGWEDPPKIIQVLIDDGVRGSVGYQLASFLGVLEDRDRIDIDLKKVSVDEPALSRDGKFLGGIEVSLKALFGILMPTVIATAGIVGYVTRAHYIGEITELKCRLFDQKMDLADKHLEHTKLNTEFLNLKRDVYIARSGVASTTQALNVAQLQLTRRKMLCEAMCLLNDIQIHTVNLSDIKRKAKIRRLNELVGLLVAEGIVTVEANTDGSSRRIVILDTQTKYELPKGIYK